MKTNWQEELRDLYLEECPDADGLYTKSITFSWGSFEFNLKADKAEFYLTTKEAIEEFIENLLISERKKIEEEWKEKIEVVEKKLQDTVWQIEKCGASEDLTRAVIMAGEVRELLKKIKQL